MAFDHYRYLREIVAHPTHQGRPTRSIARYLSWDIGRRLLRGANCAVELMPGVHIVNRTGFNTLYVKADALPGVRKRLSDAAPG